MAELAIGSAVLGAVGSIQQGRAAQSAANFQAAQLEQRAKAEKAQSQRQAIEKSRQIKLAQSRAKARMGASGIDTASPTLANILGGLDYEADLARDTELAAGENRAAGYATQAGAARIEGKQAKKAGYFGAVTAIGSAASSAAGQSLYSKYMGS